MDLLCIMTSHGTKNKIHKYDLLLRPGHLHLTMSAMFPRLVFDLILIPSPSAKSGPSPQQSLYPARLFIQFIIWVSTQISPPGIGLVCNGPIEASFLCLPNLLDYTTCSFSYLSVSYSLCPKKDVSTMREELNILWLIGMI